MGTNHLRVDYSKRTMKYHRLVSNTTPSSLQTWLEEELARRGIASVYTRYILSLLQQDYVDQEPSECLCSSVADQQQTICQQHGGTEYTLCYSKSRHQKWKGWEKGKLICSSTPYCDSGFFQNPEEFNKTAAVECLKSASEVKSGIETLVDEVCIKLKKISNITVDCYNEPFDLPKKDAVKIPPSSPKDLAEKYYAAFPALDGKTEPMTDLSLQHNLEVSFESVWNGRFSKESVQNYKVKCLSKNCRQSSTEQPSENVNINIGITEISKYNSKSSKIFEKKKKTKDINNKKQKPFFIVPKMRTTLLQKPLSVKYLPFNMLHKNSNNLLSLKDFGMEHSSDFIISDFKSFSITVNDKSTNNESKNNTNCTFPNSYHLPYSGQKVFENNIALRNEHNDLFQSFLKTFQDCENIGVFFCSTFSDLLHSNIHLDCEDVFFRKQLLSKFNNSAPSILRTNRQGQKIQPCSIDLHCQSLQLSSVRDNDLEFKDDSPWAINRDKIDQLNANAWPIKLSDYPETSEIFCDSAFSNLLHHTESQSNLFKNHDSYKKIKATNKSINVIKDSEEEKFSNAKSTENVLNSHVKQNTMDNLDNVLHPDVKFYQSVFPNSLLSAFEKTDQFCHFSSEKESITPPTFEDVQNKSYSLWKSDSCIKIGTNIDSIWDPSLPNISSNWPPYSLNQDNQCDWESPNELFEVPCKMQWSEGDSHVSDTNDSTLNTVRCTLNYHKGESKFVEVTPSQKLNLTSDWDESDDQAIFQSDSEFSNEFFFSDDNEEEEENLLTSHKTHFQPIKQDSLDKDHNADTKSAPLCKRKLVFSPTETDRPKKTNRTHQILENEDKPGVSNMKSPANPMVINSDPLISIKSLVTDYLTSYAKENKRGRSISSSFEELTSLTGPSWDDTGLYTFQESSTLSFLPFNLWKSSDLKDKGTNTETLNGCRFENCRKPCGLMRPSNSLDEQLDGSKTESCKDYSKTPGRKPKQHDWIWSTCMNSKLNKNIWIETPALNSLQLEVSKNHCNIELDILRRELKEEQDELFQDIFSTCISDSGRVVTHAMKEIDSVISLPYNIEEFKKNDKIVTSIEENPFIFERNERLSHNFLRWNDMDKQFPDPAPIELYERCFSTSDLDMEQSVTSYSSIPTDNLMYSSDLEKEWDKKGQQFDMQIPRKKYKFPPYKRPCSFYLEGNCRRQDCRFSHDLSSITCRFWVDGTCFKGITCPFLHGYVREMNSTSSADDATSDSKYTLESEADFPSLSATNSEKTKCKSSPQNIVPVKVGKRKRGKSQTVCHFQKEEPTVSSSWPR